VRLYSVANDLTAAEADFVVELHRKLAKGTVPAGGL
jgi:hypothetical protein